LRKNLSGIASAAADAMGCNHVHFVQTLTVVIAVKEGTLISSSLIFPLQAIRYNASPKA